ncbi:hypothetical protein Hte_005271 [Hypoxylon texense]
MFELRAAPGKGLGMFATRDIQRGEMLIHETALISLTKEQDKNSWWAFLYEEFEKLSPEDQATYLELSYLPNDYSEYVTDISDYLSDLRGIEEENLEAKVELVIKIMAIYAVNNAELSNDCKYSSGVFATYTRINHSCIPNAAWTWQPESQALEVCASQDIAADEEITISYIITISSYRSRAVQLADYGFECRCRACDGPDKEVSDQRRQRLCRINEMFEVLDHMDPDRDPNLLEGKEMDAVKLAYEFVDLLKAEGLVGSELTRALVYFHVVVNPSSLESWADQSSH